MITIFNRRELAVTFSMERQTKIRDILAGDHINYIIKTRHTSGGGCRSRTGSFGINLAYAYEYYIYVHKNDYEKATYLVGSVR